MEYYTPIKRNTFESVLVMWTNLELVIQNEISQKEKNKYRILRHIYMESRKMVLINLFARQEYRLRHREQTRGYSGRRRGWGELGE